MKNKGCLTTILTIVAIILFLPFAIIGGFIYLMVKLYKTGKFDAITFKTNELLKKAYFKISKKEMNRNVFSPKSFTITFTILLFLIIGSFADSTKLAVDSTVTVSQSESATKNTSSNSTTVSSNNKEETPTGEEAEIHFINTGNLDSILIIQGTKAALIDAEDNDDEQRVVSYLKKHGVTELEYVFATHPHSDHIGGLDAVVDSIPVKNLFVSNGDSDTKTYSDFINSMANKGVHPSVPRLDSEFKLGTATFKVISVANANDLNNDSIVLEFVNGKDKALFMGAAEKEIEGKLDPVDIDLIKIGHHGSHSSSSQDFLKKVTPEYAVITCGKDNKYGHPHKETMDTLKDMNIEVHRSDECGDIVFKSTGNGFTVDCKKGSYEPGTEQQNVNTDKTTVTPIITPNPKPQPVVEPEVAPSSEVVYWTPNGKSYHTTKSCPTLSRSKTILSGTQSESGKSDPCDRCH
ncbi:ComEC/Rec2 family competence protein [Paraclostridium bifermentans]|nr:MBL fold metallo-hydrolase [Paraclostridium bifermentans]